MAAATENAQSVSALDGVYKPLPSAEGGNLRENGPVVDNENSCVTEKDMVDVHNGGRPPRPRPASMSALTTVSIRGCMSRALICEVALASDSVYFFTSTFFFCDCIERQGLWTCLCFKRQGFSFTVCLIPANFYGMNVSRL
jgi:hypothetical protein